MAESTSGVALTREDGEGDPVRTARNVLLVVGGELGGKVATLVFTVVVARALGPSAFGTFTYGLAFGLLLATLPAWGFDAELVRRGSLDRTRLGTVLAETLVLRTLHALPVLVLGGLLGALTRPTREAALVLLLLLAAAMADCYGDAARSAAVAVERLGRTSLALVVQRVAACVLGVAVLALGGGLVAVTAAYLASSVLGLLAVAVVVARLGVRPDWSGVDRTGLRSAWRRSFLIGIDTVVAMALFRLDAVLIGVLRDDDEVAVYAVAYRLLETVLFVNWAVSRSIVPALTRAAGGPDLLRLGERALGGVAAVLVPYGVVLLLEGGELLRLLFGDDYGRASIEALHLLAFAPLAFSLGYFGGYLLLALERRAQVLLATCCAVVANIGLNLALIPPYGARGAALATTVSYLLEGVATLALVAPGQGWLRVDRALLLPVGASLPLAAVLHLLDTAVLLEVTVAAAVYAAAYLLLVQWRDPAQLTLLRGVVRRS